MESRSAANAASGSLSSRNAPRTLLTFRELSSTSGIFYKARICCIIFISHFLRNRPVCFLNKCRYAAYRRQEGIFLDFDMRTLMSVFVLLAFVASAALAYIWRQNRKRYNGIYFWFLSMLVQMLASLLITLRGIIPDLFSVVMANILVVDAILFLQIGLERFIGIKRRYTFEMILMAAYLVALLYFSLIEGNISIRIGLLSLMIIIYATKICLLCFRKDTAEPAKIIQAPAFVAGADILISIARIGRVIFLPSVANDLFQAGNVDAVLVVLYNVLTSVLIITLIIMVNRRLVMDIQMNEQKYNIAFHSSPHAIVLTRLSDGIILDINESFTETTGYSASDSVGKTTLDINFWLSQEDRKRIVLKLTEDNEVKGAEIPFRKKNGQIFYSLYSASILKVNHENCILSNISDITEMTEIKRELQNLATHDGLTGLPNRTLLYDRLELAIEDAKRNSRAFTVMTIDIDKFKTVNDTMGHQIGDQVLTEAAKRLTGILRKEDTVARYGGDEFVVLLEDTAGPEAAALVCDKMIREFTEPLQLEDRLLTISFSIGIALFPTDGTDTNMLLKHSDEALYRVKGTGGNGYSFFRKDAV